MSERRGRKAPFSLALLVAFCAALAISTGTHADVAATPDSIVNFDSRISPRVLPRSGLAPVSISIEGHLKPRKKGRRTPPLRKIELGIHKAAEISTRGLPACDVNAINPASTAVALATCPGARIGYGRLRAQTRFPGQPLSAFNGRVVLFNGRLENGKPAILLHVFHANPPSSFVVPFRMSVAHHGIYGTILTASAWIGRWARITDFELVLKRRYGRTGHKRSFLNASCPAPDGLSIGISPFVQATLSFADGTESRIAVVSSCKVG